MSLVRQLSQTFFRDQNVVGVAHTFALIVYIHILSIANSFSNLLPKCTFRLSV